MMMVGKDVVIEEGAIINVAEGSIGDRSIVRSGARVEGSYVWLGRECYLDHGAWIGGGSCHDPDARLKAGDWLHMGWNSQINIARGVDIGEEVGIGIETKIFTHGAYLPVDYGFPAQWGPVKIGSRVWLPHAWVNPGVTIGDNVVVGAMSLVNRDIPSGSFAFGIPVAVQENVFPKQTKADLDKILTPIFSLVDLVSVDDHVYVGDTTFKVRRREVTGPVTENTEIVKNQLRRNGIRFKFKAEGGRYVPW